MYTYHYLQPDDYHFSLDSIHLAKHVSENLQSRLNLESLRVLDLCAGCGVIGFELSWHIRALRKIDFIEVQDIYTAYFHKNVSILNRPELQLHWQILNYEVLLEESWKNKYDLIISNPPYFQPGHGILSPSTFKNRCRFFLDSSFKNYILALANTLACGGEAYFLLRSLKQHGYDLFSDVRELLQDTTILVEKMAQIRGTDIILMRKLC